MRRNILIYNNQFTLTPLIRMILSLFLILAFLSGCEKDMTPPEVKNCLKNFITLAPDECLLRIDVGGYKMEIPLQYGPSIHQPDSDNNVYVSLNKPADKRLFKYIVTPSSTAGFLTSNSVFISVNGEKFDRIIALYPELLGLKNAHYISIKKSKSSIPIRKIFFGDDIKSTNDIQGCTENSPFERGRYKLENKSMTPRLVNISYHGRMRNACSVRMKIHIQDQVYMQLDVPFPAMNNGTSLVDWLEPADWVFFFKSLDAFLNLVSFKEE